MSLRIDPLKNLLEKWEDSGFFNSDGIVNTLDDDHKTLQMIDYNGFQNQFSEDKNYFSDLCDPLLYHDKGSPIFLIEKQKDYDLGMDEQFEVVPQEVKKLPCPIIQNQFIEIMDDQEQYTESRQTGESSSPELIKLKKSDLFSSDSQRIKIHRSQIRTQKNLIQEIESQQRGQTSSDCSNKTKKDLPHLRMDRRKKGKRNRFQQKVNGYWTNNLLRWAKKYHYDFLIEEVKEKYFDNHEQIYKIFNKICPKTGKKMQGINMPDYVKLYSEKSLEKIWEKFFSHKILFRQLMLSKTDIKVKEIYLIFLENFERAFKTKKFEFLSRKQDKISNI